MRSWNLVLSVGVLVVVVGAGCSTREEDKEPGPLSSWARPAGNIWENVQLDSGDLQVTLERNRAGARIHYTKSDSPGAVPADPTTFSPVFNSASPITIDSTHKDSSFTIKYFAYYQDPTTLEIEQEDTNTDVYTFREDIHPPTVSITPSSGSYADPGAVTVTILATDTHDTTDQITVWYTTTNDGSTPEDPRTSSGVQEGTGDGVDVPWTGGILRIRTYAVDQAGNASGVTAAQYTVDTTAAAQQVMELINADRRSNGVSPDLTWKTDWAAACTAHAAGLERAGNDEHQPNNYDDENKQLYDADKNPATGYHIQASARYFGTQATGPTDFYDKIKMVPNLLDALMSSPVTEFGCGFDDDTWEMMCTNNP